MNSGFRPIPDARLNELSSRKRAINVPTERRELGKR
jgi:hypothetical protein